MAFAFSSEKANAIGLFYALNTSKPAFSADLIVSMRSTGNSTHLNVLTAHASGVGVRQNGA